MGRHRDYNGGNSQSWMISGSNQIRLYSLFCLFLLLALFFIPQAHQRHLHTLGGLYPPPASGAEKQVGLQLSATEPEGPDHHHHDAATCPICQAALNSGHFVVPALVLPIILALPVQLLDHYDSTPGITNPAILAYNSRSPPNSL
jgi:hypothetical protein